MVTEEPPVTEHQNEEPEHVPTDPPTEKPTPNVTQPNLSRTSGMKKRLLKDNMLSESEFDFIQDKVIPEEINSCKLAYRLSGKSGFQAGKFHSKCDDLKISLFVCESDKGKRFGGINFVSWGPGCDKEETDRNMLFSLTHETVHPLRVHESGDRKGTNLWARAVLYSKSKGPMMGESDLVIGDKCHEKATCESEFDTYEYTGEEESEKYLAGAEEFKLKKFFIFKLE